MIVKYWHVNLLKEKIKALCLAVSHDFWKLIKFLIVGNHSTPPLTIEYRSYHCYILKES